MHQVPAPERWPLPDLRSPQEAPSLTDARRSAWALGWPLGSQHGSRALIPALQTLRLGRGLRPVRVTRGKASNASPSGGHLLVPEACWQHPTSKPECQGLLKSAHAACRPLLSPPHRLPGWAARDSAGTLPSGRALGFLSPPSSISSKAKATLWTCRGGRSQYYHPCPGPAGHLLLPFRKRGDGEHEGAFTTTTRSPG